PDLHLLRELRGCRPRMLPGTQSVPGTRGRGIEVKGGAVYDTIHVGVKATGPGSCRVTVAGDLDLYSAPTVRDTLRDALSRHGRVVVDCSRLSFIDCTGLSALLAAARAAKAKGAELRLCAVSHALARLLRLSHTAGAFTIEPDPTD
ncbi:STAS domain-containing protein, partial [Streptomyces sp. NPDC005349]|uniref:STAS domain-containing protein n=1 Tax=Streptomyces sp. NPDC005349 TaxID=3157037 RepID=UPI0033B8C2D6